MSSEFYFISDLHFGGDGSLMHCDFTEEFVNFLKRLARKDKKTELIIAGDTFGFWELTTIEGTEQFDEIVKHHRGIFEQFKLTGAKILRRVRVRFGLLPGIYFPTFRLNYFKIYAEQEKIVVKYAELTKKPIEKLTLLQRFLIFCRKPDAAKPIPAQTIL